MNNEFKIGDKVEYIGVNNPFLYIKNGSVYTVSKCGGSVELEGVTKPHSYSPNQFKLVQPKQFTKSDLKERNIVKTRNNKEYVILYGTGRGITDGEYNGSYLEFKNYNNDLTDKNKKQWDIVEVWKQHYSKVWTRTEEDKPVEMTVSEIEKKLGHKVEVIADDRS